MINQAESIRSKVRRRFLLLLLLIDAFFIGGMLTLFLVSQLVVTQVYTPPKISPNDPLINH